MRKRKERTEERSEIDKEGEGTEEIDKEGDQKGFFACYLLCSLCPRFKGHTYIGFTVNPCRRIKQHNGEMTSGAWRTKRKRPWEMVLCIYGFPTNVSALQFEWAWQHPRESLAVRKAAASFTSFSGIAKHIKLAYTMLTLPPWQSLKLIVNFFSTKYTSHCAGCPSLPKQMKVQVCAMDELPCYIEGNQLFDENEAEEEEEDKDDGSGNSNEHISERLINTSVDNTAAVDQNIYHDWEKWTEDDCLRHPNSPSEEDNEIPDTGFDNQSPLMNRNLSLSSEDRFGRLAGSFTQKHDEECGRSYSLVDSPVGTPLSSISKTAVIDEDRDRFLVDEERSKLQSETPKVTDNDQPPSSSKSFDSSPEVEVISLLTPSPNSIVHYFRKKKRPSSDIIDLTKSPMFVQL